MSSNDIDPVIGEKLLAAKNLLLKDETLLGALNLRALSIHRGKIKFSAELPDDFLNHEGNVHSALLTIVLDSVFGLAAITMLDELKPVATINLYADYINDAAANSRVICSATCDDTTSDVVHINGDITEAETGKLIARGVGTFMIGTSKPDGRYQQ